MDKTMMIPNFLLIFTLMIVQLDARRLEAKKVATLEDRKLARLEATKAVKNVENVQSNNIDKAKLELEYKVLEKWYKDGVSLADARKQSPAVDTVVNGIIDRIKQDPINPDGTEKSMVVNTYANGLCELARQLENPTYIEMWCQY